MPPTEHVLDLSVGFRRLPFKRPAVRRSTALDAVARSTLHPHSGPRQISFRRVASRHPEHSEPDTTDRFCAPESQARLERIVAQEALNEPGGGGAAGVRGVRVCATARGTSAQLAGSSQSVSTRMHKAGRIALTRRRGVAGARNTAAAFRRAGGGGHGGAGYGHRPVAGLSLERVEQGRSAPGVEYLAATSPSIRRGRTTWCGLPGALSQGGLGARGARRGRVFGVGVAFDAAREANATHGWTGPDFATPEAHLHRVLMPEPVPDPPRPCNAATLASQVLGQVLAQFASGFRGSATGSAARGLSAESLRRAPRMTALSFKAVQLRVGRAHGRSRAPRDRDHARARPVKSVYMYRVGCP